MPLCVATGMRGAAWRATGMATKDEIDEGFDRAPRPSLWTATWRGLACLLGFRLRLPSCRRRGLMAVDMSCRCSAAGMHTTHSPPTLSSHAVAAGMSARRSGTAQIGAVQGRWRCQCDRHAATLGPELSWPSLPGVNIEPVAARLYGRG